MGGTEFNEGNGNYWLPAPNSGGVDVSPSALSYIPEVVWNDTLSSQNTSNTLLAGGGGASTYVAKPSWQVGVTPNDNARDVPDVSLNASSLHDAYLVCVQGSCINGYRNATLNLTVAGGTSAASPTFGAIVALLDEELGKPQGNINPILYAMAVGTSLEAATEPWLFTTSQPATTWCHARPARQGAPLAARSVTRQARATTRLAGSDQWTPIT